MPDPRIEYLRGETNEVYARVHGKTIIKKGDLIIIAQDATTISTALADGFAYPPYPSCKGSTATYFYNNLLGVAMKGSESGVTEDIPVATRGIFRAQIKLGTSATSKHVFPGALVSACTIGSSGVSVSNTTVTVDTLADTEMDQGQIGRAIKHEASATHVDFMLLTKMSGNSIAAR